MVVAVAGFLLVFGVVTEFSWGFVAGLTLFLVPVGRVSGCGVVGCNLAKLVFVLSCTVVVGGLFLVPVGRLSDGGVIGCNLAKLVFPRGSSVEVDVVSCWLWGGGVVGPTSAKLVFSFARNVLLLFMLDGVAVVQFSSLVVGVQCGLRGGGVVRSGSVEPKLVLDCVHWGTGVTGTAELRLVVQHEVWFAGVPRIWIFVDLFQFKFIFRVSGMFSSHSSRSRPFLSSTRQLGGHPGSVCEGGEGGVPQGVVIGLIAVLSDFL